VRMVNPRGPSHASDEDLIRRVAAGDVVAFGELYKKRRMDVHRFAFQMTGSTTLADDVTQEVFLTLIEKISDYDSDRGTFLSYVFGIARKHLLRHFERWRPDVPLPEPGDDGLSWTPESLIERSDPLGQMTRAETVDRVRRAVLALPARYREAVVLCEFHEMGYEEAANAAGCAVGTIRSRLHRARALLLKRLKDPACRLATTVEKPKGCLA
jgi:RNA polymerase sigma-70 factor, ECF subfamily